MDSKINAFRKGISFARFCEKAKKDSFQAEILLEILQKTLGNEDGSLIFNKLSPVFNPHEIDDLTIQKIIKKWNN